MWCEFLDLTRTKENDGKTGPRNDWLDTMEELRVEADPFIRMTYIASPKLGVIGMGYACAGWRFMSVILDPHPTTCVLSE